MRVWTNAPGFDNPAAGLDVAAKLQRSGAKRRTSGVCREQSHPLRHLVTSEPLARVPIPEIRLFPGKIQQYPGSENAQRFTIRDFCGPAFDLSQMAKE